MALRDTREVFAKQLLSLTTRAAAVIGRIMRNQAAREGETVMEFCDFLRLLVMRPWKRLLPATVVARIQEYQGLQVQLEHAGGIGATF
jgi:hypothetical protein